MEIAVFKDKSYIRSFRLEYLELKKSIWFKLNCFGFLTRRPTSLPSFSRKKSSYEKYIIFLRRLINSASRQVLWRKKIQFTSQTFKLTSKFLFGKFNFSKSKFKAWRFYARLFLLLFFRKIVIALLKCKFST